MKPYSIALSVATLCLSACATSPPTSSSVGGDYIDASIQTDSSGDETNLLPPLPSFSTADDCARAYPDADGGCASAAVVYESAGLPPPTGAYSWFIPYTFGVMTNVLLQNYFAPPAPYIFDMRYETFTSVTVIDSYKHITRQTIDIYNHAPARARALALRSGPARYSPTRGTVTLSRPSQSHSTASYNPHRDGSYHPPAASTYSPPPKLTPTLPYRSVAASNTNSYHPVSPSSAPTSSIPAVRSANNSSSSSPTYSAPPRVAPSSYVPQYRPAPAPAPVPRNRSCTAKVGGSC